MNNHTGKAIGQPLNGAMIFDTPEAFFNALLGPVQHDAHVKRHRVYRADKRKSDWLAERAIIESKPTFSGKRYAT